MRSTWWIFVLGFIFTVGGIFVIMRGKVEVEPTRVLNPTNFETPEQIGAVIFRRFWQEIHDQKLVIVGSSPFLKDYDRVWLGFLKVAAYEGSPIQRVFAQEGLRDLGMPTERLEWEKVQAALAGTDRILVHVVSTDEMLHQAQERTMGGFLLFQDLLPVSDGDVSLLKSRCQPAASKEVDKNKIAPNSMRPIACIGLESLSHGKKKKFDAAKITAVVEKHGLREHFLFIHER